jgi:4-hydroxy-2-oxovalerate aldolase
MSANSSTSPGRAILLDCTLRDGSYAVNFQFTRRDTARLCATLDQAGIQMIEVGHGMGLGASSVRNGVAFETDEEYMSAAAENVKRAKWGAFFIAGIGSADDIRRALDHGIGFLRIGSEVEEFRSMMPFAEQAKAAGLLVCANLMKTYAASSQEVARVTGEIERWGIVDCVYVVDSAGCMMPGEVREYVDAMKQAGACDIGFHGHNNLDLANANCLVALEAGALYIDGSIRGMGRSAGNAQTEVLAYLLKQRGFDLGIDCFSLFEAGEKVIQRLNVQPQGLPPLDIVIGMARFHTAHLPRFKRAAEAHNIDLRRLILEVSAIDCVKPSDDLIDSVAKDLARIETWAM